MVASLGLLDDLAALATAFAAIIAMWRVGHQGWRRPVDMYARRVILAILACAAMAHFLVPNKFSEFGQQASLLALLIVIALRSSPRGIQH